MKKCMRLMIILMSIMFANMEAKAQTDVDESKYVRGAGYSFLGFYDYDTCINSDSSLIEKEAIQEAIADAENQCEGCEEVTRVSPFDIHKSCRLIPYSEFYRLWVSASAFFECSKH